MTPNPKKIPAGPKKIKRQGKGSQHTFDGEADRVIKDIEARPKQDAAKSLMRRVNAGKTPGGRKK